MEPWQAFVLTLGATASAVSAVLAWTVRLRWSEEERRAKEAQIALVEAKAREGIKEKDATIEALKQANEVLKLLNYKEARDQLLAARASFEEIKSQLSTQVSELTARLTELKAKDEAREDAIRQVVAGLREIREDVREAREGIDSASKLVQEARAASDR